MFFHLYKYILKDMHKTSNYHIHSGKNMSSVSVTQLHWRHDRLLCYVSRLCHRGYVTERKRAHRNFPK